MEWHPGVPVEYRDAIVTGDALELLANLPGSSVDLVVTDPPYMLGATSFNRSTAAKVSPWGDLMNGAVWFAAWYREVLRVLRPAGAMWTFLNWRSMPTVIKAALDAGGGVASVLVWDKEWIGPGGHQGLRPRYELVALVPRSGFAIADRSLPDIRACKWASHKPTGHPAEKPVELLRWLIEVSTGPGAVVLDPFMGSGTTAVAATRTGRHWIGFELSPEYVAMAEQRLASAQLSLDIGAVEGDRGVET